MLHYVARSARGQLLFATWLEAQALWQGVHTRVPGLVALCLMPDHLHLLTRTPSEVGLGHALRAYARWRNARRGERGVVFERRPPPTLAEGRVKEH